MTKEQFREVHGAEWARTVSLPSFFSAMRLCSAERLLEIENLSASEIEMNGKVHLASFQGHLKTESILIGLAIETQPGGFDLPPADYSAPIPEDDPNKPQSEPLVSFPVFEPKKPQPKPQKKPQKRKRK